MQPWLWLITPSLFFLSCRCLLRFLFTGQDGRTDGLASSPGSSADGPKMFLMCNLPLFCSCLIPVHRQASTMLQLIATSQQVVVRWQLCAAVSSSRFFPIFLGSYSTRMHLFTPPCCFHTTVTKKKASVSSWKLFFFPPRWSNYSSSSRSQQSVKKLSHMILRPTHTSSPAAFLIFTTNVCALLFLCI